MRTRQYRGSRLISSDYDIRMILSVLGTVNRREIFGIPCGQLLMTGSKMRHHGKSADAPWILTCFFARKRDWQFKLPFFQRLWARTKSWFLGGKLVCKFTVYAESDFSALKIDILHKCGDSVIKK